MVALAAQGVLSSGDTTALHGENIVAYRSGLLLRDLHDRSTPPLTTYLTAPALWLFGSTSLAARLPCALLGLALMGFTVVILRKTKKSNVEALIWYIAILGNISLFLFLRQSRYYAPSILLVSLITVLYCSWSSDQNKNLFGVISLFALLFAANYMACLALFVCVAFDYGIWKRKTTPFPLKVALPWLFGSCLFCALIAMRWNPYLTGFGAYTQGNTWTERLVLFYWNFRDTAACQFWSLGLLLAGLGLAIFKKDLWLQRGWVSLGVFIAVISWLSPQLIAGTSVADVRYLAPAIPFGLAVSVRAFLSLFKSRSVWTILLSIPIFWTNLGSGAWIGNRPLICPIWSYLHELMAPPTEPYSPVSAWISSHLSSSQSVWVVPDYACYPLMFHAPHAIYAWQLRPEQKNEEQFKDLPDVHFRGVVPPDFIVVFGPSVVQIRQLIGQWSMQGLRYQEVARLMTFWKDLYRPELFWRSFKPIENFDPNTEAIYIFQRQS